MFPYWLLFALFAIPALVERYAGPGVQRRDPILLVLALFLIAMIGLRFEVGGDWSQYERMFELASSKSLERALDRGDPGYQFVNWLVGEFGGDVWHVNLVCASIFVWGLIRLCAQEPLPRLAALIAIPYLVVVVAMGYTRQAVAIGFIMAGLAALFRGSSVLKFALYVVGAALFHRTAVIVLPLAIFAGRRNHFLNVLAIAAIAYGLYSALLAESVETLVENYIEARYGSQGAAVRVMMNVLPAMVILIAGRKLGFTDYQARLWRVFAIVALAMVPLLFIVPSTTAVDRIALYLLPIQMVGLGRSIFLLKSLQAGRIAIAGYCALVLFVWLNFAAHAYVWIPYQLTPL